MSAWLNYKGGGCPVAPWLKVEVSVDGGQVLAARNAIDWPWTDPSFRIAKYRVVDAPGASTDWIEWSGGPCPVDRETWVRVKLRDGYVTPGYEQHHARNFIWTHSNGRSWEIIAYQIVEPSKSPEDNRDAESALTTQVGGDHYKGAVIQPVEFCVKNKMESLESAIVKRAFRHDKPTGKGREDVEKIIHEARLLLELKYGVAA